MCGIAGVVNAEAPAETGRLERMIGMIRHRGPDASGVYVEGNAGLAHARLSIVDLAGGAQPMANEDKTLWITFNGEIYNYVELRAELAGRGHRLATQSDTEVILHLYEDLGTGCVDRLNGQWAFAIWDARARQLFLSRDRMGVRPLFYAFAGGDFLFASEIKALFTDPRLSRRLDLRALGEIFTYWHCLPPRTAFEGVHELPPAHSAVLAGGRLEVRRYWAMNYKPAEIPGAGSGRSEADCAERLLALLEDATRIRLRADVPVGAYLSGGLDSTVVAALARRQVSHRLKTFSVRFEESDFDEGAYQAEAIRHLGTEHEEIRCSNAEIGRVFPEVVWHAEKPLVRTSPAPLFLLSKLVRSHGYKVVLTGEGSDEMLGGYDIFKEYKIRRFWARHAESRFRPYLLRRLYPYLKNIQAQPEAYLRAFFHVTEEEAAGPFFSHLPRWRLTEGLKVFLTAEAQAAMNGHAGYADLERQLPAEYSRWDGFSRAQYLEACYLLPGYILSSQGDRVAMAHAVEGRFPFLDCRLVEFTAGLPPTLKMKVLNEKYLLKRCAKGLAPELVVKRHKQPYRAPECGSFCPEGRPLDYVSELLSPARLQRDGIFQAGAVGRLLAKARQGAVVGLRENMALTAIISTQILMERFMTHFQGGETQ
jgi:asparagine synthase (glutamine-hydrolysing)